jgi:hypothetical protein
MADDKTIKSEKAPQPVGAYPHARKVGDLLYLSGIGPRPADGGLAPGAPAIQRTDLAAATALVVDEAIFVSGSDGRIRRLSESGEQGFPVPELDRPLLVPASLAVGQTSGLLYAVDRGNNRVVIFTTRGELVAQLRADLLIGVRAVVPDELNRRLYYVTEDALLTSALPEELLR